jgi:hypothetical protein
MNQSFNVERPFMNRRIAVVAAVLVALSAVAAQASNIQLTINFVPGSPATAGTWTATASSVDAQNLGLASYSLDIIGTDGISIQKMATASQTNPTPNTIYTLFRTTGTASGQSLINLGASQDTIGAASNNDDSGLRFGDTLLTQANGTFKGPIPPGGALLIAQGRYTNAGQGGNITAQLSAGTFFNLMPTNYDVNDTVPPAGSSQGTQAAQQVLPNTKQIPAVPEPAALLLAGIGSFGLIALRRRYR